jgi:CRISPR-associated protein Csm1
MITVLAALLHDLGKFSQRAGRQGTHSEASAAFVDAFDNLFPYAWKDDIRDGAGNHHRVARKEVEKIVKVADWLASAEREELAIPQNDPDKTPLLPVTACVEFREEKPEDWHRRGFGLNPLRLEEQCVFPARDTQVSSGDYRRLWAEFERELRQLQPITDYFRLIGFLALLRKYASFIPSATPWEDDEEYRTLPDISLYDHLKVAGAIASCLLRLHPDHLDRLYQRAPATETQPVARLLRGDLSGIQNFLYRIARAGAESTAKFRNTAKRLRGRSFFLSLLADVTADWLARELGLPPANILFCGGGRFDLLIGVDNETTQKLNDLTRRLQSWLLEKFHGELGIQLALVDLFPQDFKDLSRALAVLEARLAANKQQKFLESLDQSDFFVDSKQLLDVCDYCRVTPKTDAADQWPDGMCPPCALQRDVGGKLPRAHYLAYRHGQSKSFIFPDQTLINLSEPFGVDVALLSQDELRSTQSWAGSLAEPVVLYRLNHTDFLCEPCPANVACGFKFLGNAAPVAQQKIEPVKPGKEPVERGEVLDFDEVAAMGRGARLLGVLKADVDYLGQVFGLGVKPQSISRLATLSSLLDLFFAGWINRVCETLAARWHADPGNDNPLKGKVDGLFYLVYSGGDDLLMLGPWDAIIDAAQEIYAQFRDFTCHNENLTLSAGILLVKPHFPIQRFAQLAGKQLEQSKQVGEGQDHPGLNRKDRVTVFRNPVRWRENDKGFDRLLGFGKKLAERVAEGKLPRSFVYFLMRLHDQHFTRDGKQDPMWVPKLHYALARRVSKEVIEDQDLNLHDNVARLMRHIRIPASYASLKMRRE